MEELVNVIVIKDDPLDKIDNKNYDIIQKLFSDTSFFKVMFLSDVAGVDVEEIMKKPNGKDIVEKILIESALRLSKSSDPGRHTIILKDTSTSIASIDEISDDIRTIMNLKNIEICYLCKWLDKCSEYKKFLNGENSEEGVKINSHVTFTEKAVSPKGLQAVMFSPEGRDIILNEKETKTGKDFGKDGDSLDRKITEWIENGDIQAMCVFPNLIEYDIKYAKTPEDYLKLQQCIDENESPKPEVKNNTKEIKEKQHSCDLFISSDRMLNYVFWGIVIIALIYLFKSKRR